MSLIHIGAAREGITTGDAGKPGLHARSTLIAAIAFLTLVDLFAAQAILPVLAARYHTTAGAMGVAVNACTLGMAVGSLGVALLTMRSLYRVGAAAPASTETSRAATGFMPRMVTPARVAPTSLSAAKA